MRWLENNTLKDILLSYIFWILHYEDRVLEIESCINEIYDKCVPLQLLL